ncbi:MAG: hypothetical protein LBT59_18375 [Clostridiales bacterium]|nr:hypothetical protein [Clostridiales bacterium]
MAASSRATAARTPIFDCIGLLEDDKCKWLNVTTCLREKCSFYQRMDSLGQAFKRLSTLDEATQTRIAEKYYSGSKPWMNPALLNAENAE